MQTTSATWKALYAAGAPLEARAVIGGTNYTDISAPVISRAAMQDRLSIGNVVSAALQLSVRTGAAIARSASVAVEVRLNDGETASEWLPAGKFYIARRARDPVTGVLALECYDALLKANAVWEPSSGAWPRTMGSVVTEFLTLLGVSLDSRTVIPSGAAFVVSEPAEGTTIRDVLGMIGQAGGGNWIITPENKLRLAPLVSAAGAAEAEDDVADVAGVVGALDVSGSGTITGIRDTWKGDVSLTGTDSGIVVDVSLPPVTVAQMADALLGQSHQAYSLEGAIYDPAAELGDYVRGGANGEIASALYSERVTLGPAFRGDIGAPEAGELSDEYPYIGANARTLALARADIQEAVDELDGELDQQEIFNRLTDNGAAQGLVLYNGQLYINATYLRSGTIDGTNVNAKLLNIVDANGNVIASFNNVITLGKTTDAHAEMDFNSFEIYDRDGNVFFVVGDMRDATGKATIKESYVGSSPTYTLKYTVYPDSEVGLSIFDLSTGTTTTYSVSADSSNTITFPVTPTINMIITITYQTADAIYHFDLGQRAPNEPVGNYSVAEGNYTAPSGNYSHAEGISSEASGTGSHAEGYFANASGDYSHAEGRSMAGGKYSHSEGIGTNANHRSQHVFGEYNFNDQSNNPADSRGDYVEIVGNGTTNSPSNARTLDWNGNETLAGGLNLGVPLGISSGGSGQTGVTMVTSISSIIAAETGFSIDSASYACWGKVAMVNVTATRTGASITSDSNMNIGILVSGKRPKLVAPVTTFNSSIKLSRLWEDGKLQVNGTWSNGASKNFYAVYILA